MVSAATAQAVIASISTPVRSIVSTWASTSTESSPMVKLTKIDPTSSGWHSGIRFGVCLAAWMPATRATARTSPLVSELLATIDVVSGFIITLHRASARRWVASLGVTSTMRARPRGSTWVRPRSLMVGESRGDPRLPADLAHAAGGPDEVHLADGVPGPLVAHVGDDGGGEVVVGPASPQHGPQIGLPYCEQAVAEHALGGEPDTVAAAAERLRDAGDDADLAAPVEVTEALCGSRAARRHHLERVDRVDGGDDLRGRDHTARRPATVGVEGHELDE